MFSGPSPGRRCDSNHESLRRQSIKVQKWAQGESGLEVNATTDLARLACEVGHQEARAADFGDYLIVHLAQVVVMLVYSPECRAAQALLSVVGY